MQYSSKGLVLVVGVAIIAASLFFSLNPAENAQGRLSYLNAFKARYSNTVGTRLDGCGTCHLDFDGGGTLNAYGQAFLAAGTNFANIEGTTDSDGDGATNVAEIGALFMPGLTCTTYADTINGPADLANYVDPANPGCAAATPTPSPTPGPGDGDGDGVLDASDNCPNWPNPSQTQPNWPIPAGDSDCDGYPDSVAQSLLAPETYLGTDPVRQCAADTTANNEPQPDGWPMDFNDNRLANGQDFLTFIYSFAQPIPGPAITVPAMGTFERERWDFTGNGIINGQDFLKYINFFAKSCSLAGS